MFNSELFFSILGGGFIVFVVSYATDPPQNVSVTLTKPLLECTAPPQSCVSALRFTTVCINVLQFEPLDLNQTSQNSHDQRKQD